MNVGSFVGSELTNVQLLEMNPIPFDPKLSQDLLVIFIYPATLMRIA